jgi:membrane protein implicated in regulation of membrane protease activity
VFALAALITFIVAFILTLLKVDLGSVSLLFLGLAFLAAHLTFAWPLTRRGSA